MTSDGWVDDLSGLRPFHQYFRLAVTFLCNDASLMLGKNPAHVGLETVQWDSDPGPLYWIHVF